MEELKQRLLELANSGIDFATQQLPEVANEYLLFKAWEHGLYIIVGLGLILTCVFIIKYFRKNMIKIIEDDMEGFYIFTFAITLVGGYGFFFTNIMNFLKVIIAPRVYIIETLMQ